MARTEQLRVNARAAAEAPKQLRALERTCLRLNAANWRDFCAFADRIGRTRLPAEPATVALFVADLTRCGRRRSRVSSRRSVCHRSMDHPTPTDHDVAVGRGGRRQLGVGAAAETALEIEALRTVVLALTADLRRLRDRMLLLVGWAAALRRSETRRPRSW
jgi:hypothetical protein